jgi:hypothetical protein
MVRRLFACRLLDKEIPLYLIEWLHNSQLPENRLIAEQRLKVISLILDLKDAMQEKGIIKADEAGEIHADILTCGPATDLPTGRPARLDEACISLFAWLPRRWPTRGNRR